ncbi:selenide, water dikinase SelD [Oscillatoria salina]|uniref:selenide, water dikinase SelD n=1 Tax=Oscillatoria salina TaxID=331517 RepID=UPI001CCF1923|nr:selenide, water dikinase SelD [Oscillatoria salina]MBZ8180755.1 selenide, water dikinase SelD [Oscillatoria salina IIICB1]
MQATTDPIIKDLVLIGGGHSHAIALLMWVMSPLPGIRLTLISDTTHTPYSGMLPGLIAGFYTFDESHIDLQRLCRFAKAQFYLDKAVGLDLAKNQVICTNHPRVYFDYLSIDIGSTPATSSVSGAAKYAIPAKPVWKFLQAWDNLLTEVANQPEKPLSLAIIGGGAGGVELALNAQTRLEKIMPGKKLTMHIFHRGKELLSNHNSWVSKGLEKVCQARQIKLHLSENVTEVFPDKIICESGLKVGCDRAIWVTQASAPDWLSASGLATDSKGFILVKDTLQSVSHSHIFAAGDIATMKNYSRPKAGVFAVRMAKPLLKNLQRIITGKSLVTYQPQKRYLSLIGTGNKCAIASWSIFGWQSSLIWVWKDYLDRKFMARFHDLPDMNANFTTKKQVKQGSLNNEIMRCAGCGAKVSSNVLERVLQQLKINQTSNIIIGLNSPDDAAVISVPANQLIVQTIDYFRSLINDPFIFGQIATNHCLNDLFAMGAKPQTALAVVTLPYAAEKASEATLWQLLSGAIQVLEKSQTVLVGGHTTEGTELAFGLNCNGLVTEEKLWRKSGMKPGELLILTKAIGTGTLFAADLRYQAKGSWIETAVNSMLLSNQEAAKIFSEHSATACTDITGFGLLGHLLEMVKAAGFSVELNLETIPILPGAMETIKRGIMSSLQTQNLRAASYLENAEQFRNLAAYQLLFDPQTSGGLLATIPAEKAEDCLKNLQTAGYEQSRIIGRVREAREKLSAAIALK